MLLLKAVSYSPQGPELQRYVIRPQLNMSYHREVHPVPTTIRLMTDKASLSA
jgi:hypothetical protein